MTTDQWWKLVAWAWGGGAVTEFVKFYRYRTIPPEQWPDYYRTWSYWYITIGMVILGGVTPILVGISPDSNTSPQWVFGLGASTPLVLGKIVEWARSNSSSIGDSTQ